MCFMYFISGKVKVLKALWEAVSDEVRQALFEALVEHESA